MSRIAITGATGFVGRTVLDQALAAGNTVQALTRRPQPGREGMEWIPGALDDAAALARLVAGTDTVIHIAGAVNARDRAGFAAGNIAGTEAVLRAAAEGGVSRFVHVSSLAAREPGLSNYCWSKAGAEAAVRASGLDWTMVRPPAVYGPGDTELLDMFRMAARGLVLLPPAGRLSVIEVSDLARLLLAAIPSGDAVGKVWEADDGVAGGWSHRDFAQAIGHAVGRPVRSVSAPRAVMKAAARADGWVRRGRAKLTPDRAAYFSHPDWVIDLAARPPAALWTPQVNTREGLRATAEWYRAQGLLR